MQEEDGRSEETPADSSSRRSATPAASESSRSIAASQGVSSHSYFLAPYLPTSRSASTNNAVESSIEMSSQASQGGGSDLAGTRRRLSSKQSQAIQERRQAALEELCLGTDGVPVHRGMLHQFTGLVKRIFDSKLSMVSLVRDEIEMVGVERYKVSQTNDSNCNCKARSLTSFALGVMGYVDWQSQISSKSNHVYQNGQLTVASTRLSRYRQDRR